MKTAISLPDDLFESAEALASRLGVSRSQLYATALARLLVDYEQGQVTARLDAIHGGDAAADTGLEPGFAALQARALRTEAGDAEW